MGGKGGRRREKGLSVHSIRTAEAGEPIRQKRGGKELACCPVPDLREGIGRRKGKRQGEGEKTDQELELDGAWRGSRLEK